MHPVTLRDRLRSVVGQPQAARASAFGPHLNVSLDQVLGGAWHEAPGGRSFVVRRRMAPGERHGRIGVDECARLIERASAVAPLLGADRARAPFMFFDLETTGLSGGAGTHAFLVGCGWFDEAGGFVTEQHFLAGYDTERQMLQTVALLLRESGAIVTFNGKSFDAPVIETRYLFHRLESPCGQLPHLDLLHPARRFWGGVESSGCSLVALESRLLGVRREGDVGGAEIPERYFQFVRTGDARPLVGVLEHNRLDLLSLAGLTAHVCRLVAAGPQTTADAREALALGRLYGRAGQDDRAEESFERASALAQARIEGGRSARGRVSPDTEIRVEALRELALGARRRRHYKAAADHWRRLLSVEGCSGPIAREAIEALAIHHEHRERDLVAAKMFALKSLELEEAPAWGDAVRHRLARIERKLVSEGRPLFPSLPSRPSSGSPRSGPRTSS